MPEDRNDCESDRRLTNQKKPINLDDIEIADVSPNLKIENEVLEENKSTPGK